MDTEQLSSQVRELLSSNSIGQRVFGMYHSQQWRSMYIFLIHSFR